MAAVIATFVLSMLSVGFLSVVLTERNLATRSHVNNVILSVAEAGLEEAIWSINQSDWSGWVLLNSDNDVYRSRNSVVFGDGPSVEFHVLVLDWATVPTIYSEAIATYSNGDVARRQLRAIYKINTNKPGGMLTQGFFDLSGQVVVDSYDSDIGPPGLANRSDKVMVGTTAKGAMAMVLSGEIDIFGYAGTGNLLPEISGDLNKIRGEDSPPGNIDWNRVSQDLNFDFPEIVQPNWTGATTTLPAESGGVIEIGDPMDTTPQRYYVDKLESSDTEIRFVGPVQLYLTDGMSIGGTGFISVEGQGSVEIYTPKDVTASGEAFVNDSRIPDKFKVFGTSNIPGGQTFSLSGEGVMDFVFYGPKANVNVSGQGEVCGSLVAYAITYSGQGKFHYDEQLSGGGNKGDGITSWHDLVRPEHRMDIDQYVANH